MRPCKQVGLSLCLILAGCANPRPWHHFGVNNMPKVDSSTNVPQQLLARYEEPNLRRKYPGSDSCYVSFVCSSFSSGFFAGGGDLGGGGGGAGKYSEPNVAEEYYV